MTAPEVIAFSIISKLPLNHSNVPLSADMVAAESPGQQQGREGKGEQWRTSSENERGGGLLSSEKTCEELKLGQHLLPHSSFSQKCECRLHKPGLLYFSLG